MINILLSDKIVNLLNVIKNEKNDIKKNVIRKLTVFFLNLININKFFR